MTQSLHYPTAVRLVEVGPRDGLQNEATMLSAAEKIALINTLSACGFQDIEATSFVHPQRVPQLQDAEAVFNGIETTPACVYSALLMNAKGLQRALACGVKKIALVATASPTFCARNMRCSIAQNQAQIRDLLETAQSLGLATRLYLSCAFYCPYAGHMSVATVQPLLTQLAALPCDEIALADTTGQATPGHVIELLHACADLYPIEHIAVHFHDTYGMALANILSALQCGVTIIDCAVAGLGGCPFAPGAGGNVASEDVVYLLQGMAIDTGIDLAKLTTLGRQLCARLGRVNGSKAALALQATANNA